MRATVFSAESLNCVAKLDRAERKEEESAPSDISETSRESLINAEALIPAFLFFCWQNRIVGSHIAGFTKHLSRSEQEPARSGPW
jgi:hypothetical protein